MATKKKSSEAAEKKVASKSVQENAGASKSAEPKAEKKVEKIFKPDTLIVCKSVRQNELFYRSNSGAEYVWNGFGDIRELPYSDIMSMKASRSAYLYEPWLLIDDEDLLKKLEFQKEFGDIYEIYKEFDHPKAFFERPVAQIKEKLKDAPKGLRELIIYNARQYIEDGTLDRIGVINALDEIFGTHLRMLV